jgi:hypothetical protein
MRGPVYPVVRIAFSVYAKLEKKQGMYEFH